MPKNIRRAKELYEKAAMQGDANGQLNLALMYLTGSGVRKDKIKAFAWFRLSAENDNKTAQDLMRKNESKLNENDLENVEKIYTEYKQVIKPYKNPLDYYQYLDPSDINYIINIDKVIKGDQLNSRLYFNGFSVKPPDGKDWTGLGVPEKSSGVGFYKDIRSKFLKSQISTVILRVSLFHLENDQIRGEEFKKYLHTLNMLKEGPRQENMVLSLTEEKYKGASCFRFTLSAEDNNAPNMRGKSFDLNAIGLECIHPISQNIHVSIVYNQRTLKGKNAKLLTNEANDFIGTVEFTEYD